MGKQFGFFLSKERDGSNRYNNSVTSRESKKSIQSKQKIQKKAISPKIINLSKYKLSKPELSLLRKSRKFTPTSKRNSLTLKSDTFVFSRLSIWIVSFLQI